MCILQKAMSRNVNREKAHRRQARHQASAQLEPSRNYPLEDPEAIKQCSRSASLCHKEELYWMILVLSVICQALLKSTPSARRLTSQGFPTQKGQKRGSGLHQLLLYSVIL